MENLFVYASIMPGVWKKVRVEILGPFPKTLDGNRYLAFAVDTCTYWMEAISLPQNTPSNIAKFILSLLFRFGRAEFGVVGQKPEFCSKLSESLDELLETQNLAVENGTISEQRITHVRQGVEHIYRMHDLGAEAGVTTGGMAVDSDGSLICNGDEELAPEQAGLFAESDPINPIPRHSAFKRIERLLKQRNLSYTNLGSDLLAYVSANPANWDQKLDSFLHNFRTAAPVCKKGYSPFHLMFGRNPSPVTGRELMVRSLTGIREVLAFFDAAGPVKNPKPRKRPRARRFGCDAEFSGEEKISQIQSASSRSFCTGYNLRQRASPVFPDLQARISKSTEPDGKFDPLSAATRSEMNSCGSTKPGLSGSPHITANADVPGPSQKKADLDLPKDKHCISAKTKRPGATNKPTIGRRKISKNYRERKRKEILKVKCPQCPNTYVTCQEELDLHLECHSLDPVSSERTFRCPECGKVCKIWLNMVRHMSHHRDISTFRKLPAECYSCKHCGKNFKVPESLREHVRVVHEGQKRFECHVCHESFKLHKTKMRHMDINHANITYACDVCNKYTTKVRRNLKLHMENHEKKARRLKPDPASDSALTITTDLNPQSPMPTLSSNTVPDPVPSLPVGSAPQTAHGAAVPLQASSANANLYAFFPGQPCPLIVNRPFFFPGGTECGLLPRYVVPR